MKLEFSANIISIGCGLRISGLLVRSCVDAVSYWSLVDFNWWIILYVRSRSYIARTECHCFSQAIQALNNLVSRGNLWLDRQRTILSEYRKKKIIKSSWVLNPLLQNHIFAQVVYFSIAGHICITSSPYWFTHFFNTSHRSKPMKCSCFEWKKLSKWGLSFSEDYPTCPTTRHHTVLVQMNLSTF